MSDDNRDRRRLVGVFAAPVLLVGVLVIVGLLILSYLDSGSRRVEPDKRQTLTSATLKKFRTTYDDRGVAIGSKTAPVTIREFGDYQCPACGAFFPVAQKVRNQIVAAGKARYVFFDYPLPIHRNAFQASIAARCAARQDQFWPYHDRLYATQDEWSDSQGPMQHFLDLAVETGVKTGPLKQCVAESRTKPTINAEKLIGKKAGLRATPTIIVGNRVFTGVISFDKIKQAVANQTNKQ